MRRLDREGLLRSTWEKQATAQKEQRPPRRYYEITREGRRQLSAQVADWERSSGAVNRVLSFAFQGG